MEIAATDNVQSTKLTNLSPDSNSATLTAVLLAVIQLWCRWTHEIAFFDPSNSFYVCNGVGNVVGWGPTPSFLPRIVNVNLLDVSTQLHPKQHVRRSHATRTDVSHFPISDSIYGTHSRPIVVMKKSRDFWLQHVSLFLQRPKSLEKLLIV